MSIAKILQAALVLLIATIGIAATTAAQTGPSVGFRTPADNIHCELQEVSPGGLNTSLRCDIGTPSNRPPARPRSCDLEWGSAFSVGASDDKAERLCAGDTVYDRTKPVLDYGVTWQMLGFTCLSEATGLTCLNATRRGFTLSRSAQKLF